jgi:hypothetical protein
VEHAADRVVNLLPLLRDELGDYRTRHDPDPGALVLGTTTGAKQGKSNVRIRGPQSRQ